MKGCRYQRYCMQYNEKGDTMANIQKYDPFADLETLQRQLFGNDWLSPLKGVNLPTTDIYNDKNNLVVEAHLPHFDPKDVSIEVDDNALVITGQRFESDEQKDRRYVVHESNTSFYRRVQLPARADKDHIEANLNEGVLKVTIPLTPLPEPKKIAVKGKK